jgi:hypothetical protein
MQVPLTPTHYWLGFVVAVLLLLVVLALVWSVAWYLSITVHWFLGLPIGIGGLWFVHMWFHAIASVHQEWRRTGGLTW